MKDRYEPLFVNAKAPITSGPRPAVTTELRMAEMRRLSQSPFGRCDLELVRALGSQFRYLRRDQAELFYPSVASPTIGRRLGQLWAHQWIDRDLQPGTHQKHPPHIYSLGALGAKWLAMNDLPHRWKVGNQATLDPGLAHWLGIADIWAQWVRFTRRFPAVALLRFDTELAYTYRIKERSQIFRPDCLFEVAWGPDRDDILMAYGELDRSTESMNRWRTFKVQGGQDFALSHQWPWIGNVVDYWVWAPDRARIQAMIRVAGTWFPFKSDSRWVYVPMEDWLTRGPADPRAWFLGDGQVNPRLAALYRALKATAPEALRKGL